MIIALLYDGRYKIYKNFEDVSIPKVKYLVIDNSTILKGKTYTIIDASKIKDDGIRKLGFMDLSMSISYAGIDTPCCNETTLQSNISLNGFEKVYSIYPLIKQLFSFNIYKDSYLSIDNMLSIDSITIKTKDKNKYLICDNLEIDDCDDLLIKKWFNDFNLKTDVYNLLGSDNHLILKNGKWYIDKHIPQKFDYIGYNLPDIETIYLLKEKQFSRLSLIKNISIDIYDRTDYSEIYGDYEYSEPHYIDEDFDNRLSCSSIEEFLQSCVYFPQLIELEKLIYGKNIALGITLSTPFLNYNLHITEEETRVNGICLFKIINKLLQM